MIYADQRWVGDHGIGRFASRVLAGLDYSPVNLVTKPSLPLDPLKLALSLRRLTRHDLFFSPGYSSPLYCAAPVILTICDLNHIDRPENSSAMKSFYYATVLKRSCHRAVKILTISEFSRTRILEWSGVSPDKVINVGCGVDSAYHPGVPPYNHPYPYLLCVSNRRLHKNEFRTVEAFARARISNDTHLVFTGAPTPDLEACIEKNKVTGRVDFLGLVPNEQMPSLYRSARALVFASLYEGFGLPVIEAMACGTPVVTSNTTSLPEVAGDAALLVDPTSVEQIAEGMERILGDTSLRQTFREKGLAKAVQFTWTATNAEVHKLLHETANGRTVEE